MIYNDANVIDQRLKPIVRFSAGYFWGGPAARQDRLDPATIDWPQVLDAIRGLRGTPFVINIEGGAWERPGADANALAHWIDMVRTVRRVHGGPVGIYRMVPERAYIEPVRHYAGNDPDQTHRQWRTRNNRLFALADEVDVIYPSLYPQEADLYRKPEHWRTIVAANLREATQYGKPVRPYVTPQFRGQMTAPLLSPEEWREQLSVIREHADDIVLYMDGKKPIPADYLEVAVDLFGDRS